jgi:hypothetical protein
MKPGFLVIGGVLLFLLMVSGPAAALDPSGPAPVMNATPPSPAGASLPDTGANSSGELLAATATPVPTQTVKPAPTPLVISFKWTAADSTPAAGVSNDDDEPDDSVNPGGAQPWYAAAASLFANITGSDEPEPDTSPSGFGSIASQWASTATANAGIPNCAMMSRLRKGLNESDVERYNSTANDLLHPAHAFLKGFTPGQFAAMQRTYAEDQGFIDTCYDLNPTPYWEIFTVNGKIMTMNVRPANFTSTLYVYSNGAKIPAINATDVYYPNRLYTYVVYVPVRSSQASMIDAMDLEFVRAS